MLTELISKVPSSSSGMVMRSPPSKKVRLYLRHSDLTSSRRAKRMMISWSKLRMNIRRNLIDLKSRIEPTTLS